MVGSELNRTRGAQNKKRGRAGAKGKRGEIGARRRERFPSPFSLYFSLVNFLPARPPSEHPEQAILGVKILGKYFVLCFCSYLSTYYYCFFEGGREGRIIQRSESVIGPRYPGRLVLPIKNNEAF